MPDKIKKIQLRLLIELIPFPLFVRKTMPHAKIPATTVRIAVAKFELIFSIPILANMEGAAANTDDSNANTNHIFIPSLLIL